jgi:hypothetical protein
MCGITGICLDDRAAPIDRALLETMTTSLAHRGPDGRGSYVAPHVGLGHRRLSIIDLAGGDQPIFNEDGTIAIVFNGEIYNYKELRKDLLSRGHQFKTESDTEVIVHLYEEFGDACVEQMNGMFAFALWDSRRSGPFRGEAFLLLPREWTVNLWQRTQGNLEGSHCAATTGSGGLGRLPGLWLCAGAEEHLPERAQAPARAHAGMGARAGDDEAVLVRPFRAGAAT